MRRKIIILLFILIFIFIFSITSFANSFTAYSSITPSNGNISMLYETMFNQDDYNPFLDWIGIRTGEFDYSVFYNIKNGSCIRLRYYGSRNNYGNLEYHFVKIPLEYFSYDLLDYTAVGNTQDTLSCSDYRMQFYQNIMIVTVPFILMALLFFIFKLKKRERGFSL